MNNLQALTLDSREVAKMIRKEHAKLLRDIDTYNGYLSQNPKLDFDMFNTNLNAKDFWEASSYVSGTGKRYKCYLITKKGCEFIAHKMTGQKGALFTATYINRFHEMEQALKERQATAPMPSFQKYTYEGRILMPAMYLMTMTKISNSTSLLIAKRFQLPYISLQGEKLAAFKQENHLVHSSASRMILYPQKTIIGLLNYQQMYNKYKEKVQQYFTQNQEETWNAEDREAVFCTTQQFKQAAQEIHKTLIAMDALVSNFEKYRRTPEEHTMYWNICRELRIKLASQFVTLKQSTLFIGE